MQSGRLLIVGGRQRGDALQRPEWQQFQSGLVVAARFASPLEPPDSVEPVFDYTSPLEIRPADSPSLTLKAGYLDGDRLYLCTQTEVLVLDARSLQVARAVSHPWFNDVHHVRPGFEGNLLVVSTGLDMVLDVEPSGNIARYWQVLGEDPWQRFDPNVDYRQVLTTKPHASHPNHVFLFRDQLWVTRFEQRDAACLTDTQPPLHLGLQRPHDGVVRGDRVAFTLVDGRVALCRLDPPRLEHVVDLNQISRMPHALGWCRGLEWVDDRHLLVGFSRLRPSRWRENLRWVKYRVKPGSTSGLLPTRIGMLDIDSNRWLWELDLEQHGMNSVYSIHLQFDSPATRAPG